MSIYKSSTLAMIPTAYKDGKLYSVRPTDGSGDFTFSRGSNLAATRVASSGYIEKGRENLLLQSNAFDTTWFLNRTSATSGQSGYDGSNDAWLLEADVAGSLCNVNQSVSISGVMTASIYAKEGTTNWFRFSVNDSGVNTRAWFDLSGSGAVGTTAGNIIDAKIESVDNGYFRCSITFNATATNLLLFVTNADNSVSYSVGDNIYIQDAQLESGLVSTSVIETTTTSVSAGILEDMPRLDYSGGASCPALLLEPQRSNLMVQSEGFSTSAWTDNKTSNTSVTANAAVSPEGLRNATEIDFTTTGGAEIYDQFTNVASSMHIGTMFLKNNGVNFVKLELTGGAPSIAAEVTIDLRDGTLSNQVGDYTPTIEDYGNGWWRVAIGDTGNATIATPAYKLKAVGSNTGSFYVYGAQVEAGSYPTSYIPTYGASVTRSVDVFTRTGISSLINSQEGTFFVDMAALSSNTGTSLLSLSDGSATNNIYIGFTSTTNQISAVIYANGSAQAAINIFSYDVKQSNKIAFSYKTDEVKLFINGSLVGTDTTATMPNANTLNEFSSDFGQGSFKLAARLNQSIIFPTALTDSECIALTTL